MKPSEVIKEAKAKGVRMVDLKFSDMLGTWQHFTIPIYELTEAVFENGIAFDGSSIRGWKGIEESDMIALPDPTTGKIDPFMDVPTLSLICDIVAPDTHEPYLRDPRQIAKRAVQYLKSTGIADTAFFGPEAEFFIFDSIRYDQTSRGGFYEIDSDEAVWNTGRHENGKNLGYKTRSKEGYFPVLPVDQTHNLRTEICLELEKVGMIVERQHHEVATAGQAEINFRFGTLVEMADQMQWFKYIVRNVARRHNKTVTFMPKPIFGDNGSGMHTHMSLWKNGEPLFAGDKYAGLSEMGLNYIGGVLKHAPATCAITNPTTNSYKRLVPGFEAPIRLAYSYKNRSAAVRIPNSTGPKAKRMEFRTPDPMANVYLCFAALLMAGIDGVLNKTNPGAPMDKDIYGLPPQELAKIPSIPGSLEAAIEALKKDSAFLLKGDVFSQDMLDNWCEWKMTKEVLPMQQRPTPYEFHMYYDA